MPLKKGDSDSAFHSNVAELIRSGRPKAQAVAIAYRTRYPSGEPGRSKPKKAKSR